jgi:hypothetical protein
VEEMERKRRWKMALRVTAKWLQKMRACEPQVELFKKTFPRGAAVTLKNLRKAEKARLDLGHLVDCLLPDYADLAAWVAWCNDDDNTFDIDSPEYVMIAIKAMVKKGRKKL